MEFLKSTSARQSETGTVISNLGGGVYSVRVGQNIITARSQAGDLANNAAVTITTTAQGVFVTSATGYQSRTALKVTVRG